MARPAAHLPLRASALLAGRQGKATGISRPARTLPRTRRRTPGPGFITPCLAGNNGRFATPALANPRGVLARLPR